MIIREADIDADRTTLIDFLRENLTSQSDEKRFDWLYRSNPYGEARAWIAFDEGKGSVIGVAAAFPRLVRVSSQDLLCWNLGDFAIKKGYRSLGPALLLQRACLAQVNEGEIPFLYDHPSDRMMAIYERIGIPATGRVVRFAKLVGIDLKVAQFLQYGPLAQGVSALGNFLLAVKDRKRAVHKGLTISLCTGSFGEDFSHLDEKVSGHFKIYGRRTTQYLNWRYGDNPLQEYTILTVRHDAELLAYAIFSQIGQTAVLVDLFGHPQPDIIAFLLAALVEGLRRRGILTLSAPALESSPFNSFLKQAGFFVRESSSFIVYTQKNGPLDGVVTEAGNWFLTHGDRDI